LQTQSQKQTEQQAEKFSKERRELNERIDTLTSECSKRDRAILSLENSKEGFSMQLSQKDKSLEEQKADS